MTNIQYVYIMLTTKSTSRSIRINQEKIKLYYSYEGGTKLVFEDESEIVVVENVDTVDRKMSGVIVS